MAQTLDVVFHRCNAMNETNLISLLTGQKHVCSSL